MSLGELIPEKARVGLDQATAQLPWDIYADIGNVYLAVLLQDTGWIMPRGHSQTQDAAELQIRQQIAEQVEPANPGVQEPINWNHL
jgi:hypothetical protein